MSDIQSFHSAISLRLAEFHAERTALPCYTVEQMSEYIPLLLSSAAIGALVSSAITFFGQYFERKARRREMLLTEAVRLALDHRKMLLEIGRNQPGSVFIPESVRLVQSYYVGLSDLLTMGSLPAGMFAGASKEDSEEFQRRFRKD